MYTKECVFLLSTFGEEIFISKWLLPLEDRKDTVITQNCVRRRKVSLYLSELCCGWMEVRECLCILLYADLQVCFKSFPRVHAYAGRRTPRRCAQAVLWSWKELIVHLTHVCYNAGSLLAVPRTRFLPCIQLRPSHSASAPRLQKDNCWSELQPMWVRG